MRDLELSVYLSPGITTWTVTIRLMRHGCDVFGKLLTMSSTKASIASSMYIMTQETVTPIGCTPVCLCITVRKTATNHSGDRLLKSLRIMARSCCLRAITRCSTSITRGALPPSTLRRVILPVMLLMPTRLSTVLRRAL